MQKTLDKIISYAAMIAEPDRIILFGSMAANKANVYSDVDILIVSDDTSVKKDIAAVIASYCYELSLKTDILIYSEKEIAGELNKPNSFIKEIIKSGKIVWSKCD